MIKQTFSTSTKNKKTFDSILKIIKLCGSKFSLVPFFAIFSGILDALSILLIGPIFNTLYENSEVSELNIVVEKFFEILNISFNQSSLIISLFILLCLRSFFIYLTLLVTSSLRVDLLEILRKEFLLAFLEVKYEYFVSKTSGFYSNILNEQTTRTLQGFYFFSQAAAFLLLSVGYMFLIIAISWQTALIASFGLMILVIPFLIINLKLKFWSRENTLTSSDMVSKFIYVTSNYKYLLATNQTNSLYRQILSHIQKLKKIQFYNGKFAAITTAMREPIGVCFLILIFIVFSEYNGLTGSENLIIILLIYRFFNSIITFQSNLQLMNENVGALEVVDTEISSLKSNVEIESSKIYSGFFKELKFKNVCFKYATSKQNTIESASFSIKKNQNVIIIGESGSGKSTICNMLTRLIKPYTGLISIDGFDFTKFDLKSYRNRIGYVSQESVFFNGTILENICMGEKISDENNPQFQKVINLCKNLNIHNFISKQKLGYYTEVGENGLKLSGGQRQRICIARELYRQPEILILDEITSALDKKSSLDIYHYLATLKNKVTMISISHALSNLRDYDKIILIDNGIVLTEGHFNELIINSVPFKEYIKTTKTFVNKD